MEHKIITERFEATKHLLDIFKMKMLLRIDFADIRTYLRYYKFNSAHIIKFNRNDSGWPQEVIKSIKATDTTKNIVACFIYFAINNDVYKLLSTDDVQELLILLDKNFLAYHKEGELRSHEMMWSMVESNTQPKDEISLYVSLAEPKGEDDSEFDKMVEEYIDSLFTKTCTTFPSKIEL